MAAGADQVLPVSALGLVTVEARPAGVDAGWWLAAVSRKRFKLGVALGLGSRLPWPVLHRCGRLWRSVALSAVALPATVDVSALTYVRHDRSGTRCRGWR